MFETRKQQNAPSKYIVKPQVLIKPQATRAFNSLSFKGNKGYCKDFLQRKQKALTYGAILCSKTHKEPLYALVQGRYTGKWSFPKGHANEGEHPMECTMREVGEETGIDNLPSPIEYVKVGYGNYYVFSLQEPIPLIPRDKKEIMDTKWVTLEEMNNLIVNADVSMFRKIATEIL